MTNVFTANVEDTQKPEMFAHQLIAVPYDI